MLNKRLLFRESEHSAPGIETASRPPLPPPRKRQLSITLDPQPLPLEMDPKPLPLAMNPKPMAVSMNPLPLPLTMTEKREVWCPSKLEGGPWYTKQKERQ